MESTSLPLQIARVLSQNVISANKEAFLALLTNWYLDPSSINLFISLMRRVFECIHQ